MKQRHVVHIVESLHTGGLERVVETIVRNLDATKFRSTIICCTSEGAIAESLQSDKYTVIISHLSNCYSPAQIFKLSRLLKIINPDIIHSHTYFSGVIGRIAARLAKVKGIVHHVHSTYDHYSFKHFFIERFLAYFTDAIVCCSQAVADFMVKNEHLPPSKLQVIYNGVSLPETFNISKKTTNLYNESHRDSAVPSSLGSLSSLRSEDSAEPQCDSTNVIYSQKNIDNTQIRQSLGITETSPIITTVASLEPHKGHHFLIDAIPDVLKVIPDARFIFVGDGTCRKSLEKQAVTLGINKHLIFAGEQSSVTPFLNIAQLFVLPSWNREGLGISLIEAMATGLPVIGTQIGGIPEVIVNGITGIIIPPAKSDVLAQAIIKILSNSTLGKSYSEAGKKRYLELFTTDIMINRLSALYDGLIN